MLWSARAALSIDSGSVSGGTCSRGWGGALEIRTAHRVRLSSSLGEAALDDAGPAREPLETALAELARESGGRLSTAAVVLPDAVGRIALLEPVRGTRPGDLARFRLAPGLGVSPDEVVGGACEVPGGLLLSIAARRTVIQGFERCLDQCGFEPRLVSFAAFSALAGLPAPETVSSVDLVLGDESVTVFGWLERSLRLVRFRLRDLRSGDEAPRLKLEIERTATSLQVGVRPEVRVVGPGARALSAALLLLGLSVRCGLPGLEAQDGLSSTEDLIWPGAAA